MGPFTSLFTRCRPVPMPMLHHEATTKTNPSCLPYIPIIVDEGPSVHCSSPVQVFDMFPTLNFILLEQSLRMFHDFPPKNHIFVHGFPP